MADPRAVVNPSTVADFGVVAGRRAVADPRAVVNPFTLADFGAVVAPPTLANPRAVADPRTISTHRKAFNRLYLLAKFLPHF